jgi:hypothetical protein
MKLFILIIGLLFNSLANAEIYEVIDESGRKIFTDIPPLNKPDAKPVSIKPHTGNTWQNDPLQEQNDRYFNELDEKEQELEAAEERATAEKDEAKQKAAEAIIAAEEALEEAKTMKAGDYFPNQNNGIRYTPEYLERVKDAEEALEKARETEKQYQ